MPTSVHNILKNMNIPPMEIYESSYDKKRCNEEDDVSLSCRPSSDQRHDSHHSTKRWNGQRESHNNNTNDLILHQVWLLILILFSDGEIRWATVDIPFSTTDLLVICLTIWEWYLMYHVARAWKDTEESAGNLSCFDMTEFSMSSRYKWINDNNNNNDDNNLD